MNDEIKEIEEKDNQANVVEFSDVEAPGKDAVQDVGKPEKEAKKDAPQSAGESAAEVKEGTSKKSISSSVLGNKTLEDVIKREAKEEQDTSSPFSLSKTLGGVIIARAVQRQIGLVLLVCVFLIIYISNRYVCQKKLVEIDNIEKKINNARFKAIVCSSTLTEQSRESNIIELLNSYGDSTLSIPTEPPYLIKIEE